jgi:hypothetical protein
MEVSLAEKISALYLLEGEMQKAFSELESHLRAFGVFVKISKTIDPITDELLVRMDWFPERKTIYFMAEAIDGLKIESQEDFEILIRDRAIACISY